MASTNIISWNINGIRAFVGKGFLATFRDLDPDVICLQETKAQDDQVMAALSDFKGYHIHSNSAEKKGYSGVAILAKQKPISIDSDIGVEEHDSEGRVIAAEFAKYYLVNVYVPNSGSELKRLDYRKTWDAAFLKYIKKLEKKKPVIVTGDFNVAHQAIDLARPKSNYNKTAGYTQVEIDGMSNLVASGLVDTFRKLHPEEVAYTFWSVRFGARAKNVGWRIDYFLVSSSLFPSVKDSYVSMDLMGSDHCPIGLKLNV